MDNIKSLLLHETEEAYSGDPEMSLKSFLGRLTQEEATWRLNATTWTIEEILCHVALCKLGYCKQAFGRWHDPDERPYGDIGKMLGLLERAHAHLVECLEACSEEDLAKPVPTHSHGESATQLFWVLLMHDLNHASEIGLIRRAYGSRADFEAPPAPLP